MVGGRGMGKALGAAGSAAGRRRDGKASGAPGSAVGDGATGRCRGAVLGGHGTAKPSGENENYQAASESHKFAGRNLRGPLELGSDLDPQFLQMDSYLEK